MLIDKVNELRNKENFSILFAEDEVMVSKPMQDILKRLCNDVVVTYDGLEAWEIYQQRDFTIVVTDLQMPNMNGAELVEKIRTASKPNQIIIVVTAFREGLEYEQVKSLNADVILQKPFSLQAFLEAVSSLEIK